MRLLVTGASGFLGRNLLPSLPTEWEVTLTYRRDAGFCRFVERWVRARSHTVQVDLSKTDDLDRLASASPEYDACVYLAANGDPAESVRRPAYDLEANTLALVTLLERVRVGRLVYFSSGAVYDGIVGPVEPGVTARPSLPYAISKLASEHYVRSFHTRGQVGEAVIVRFFGAYGPYEPERKIYNRLVRQFAFEREPRFTIRGDG